MNGDEQTDPCEYGVEVLVECYRQGKLSPLEVTRAHLRRIERFNPSVHAYTYVDVEGAETAARESERRWRAGRPASVVDGVPASIVPRRC